MSETRRRPDGSDAAREPAPAEAVPPADATPPGEATPSGEATPPARRPLVERAGMAAIAAVLAVLFGAVGAAAWASGEPFLAVMAAIGALMTAWAGAMTLLRG